MARYRELLTLTSGQREELSRWAQSRTLPAGDVFRARLILALADGVSYVQIKKTLRTTAPTISRWKQRFEQHGTILAGDLESPGTEDPTNLETAKLIIEAIQVYRFSVPIYLTALQRLGLTGAPKRI